MRIERFQIKGFKSIKDITVEGLEDINVFYGLNDVGKSNIFEALGLWWWTLQKFGNTEKEKENISETIKYSELEQEFGPLLFQLGNRNSFSITVWLHKLGYSNCSLYLTNQSVKITIPSLANDNKNREDNFHQFKPHIIKANRSFQTEHWQQGTNINNISDYNLKQALFYTYLSRDFEQKQRFAAIKNFLCDPPFSLGELDVALDPETNQIDIGFIRPTGRIPLENVGSGPQQLLLILGQIFLNDYPIVALEEPEMNLSPQYQQQLLVALRRLMKDPAIKLQQLFVSTHSPYFEFEDTFFDVTMNDKGETEVTRLPIEKRKRYFPAAQVGPETGARLNSLNQVELYEGVIEDLELQRGDTVLFLRNEAGQWEIRPESQVSDELENLLSEDATA